MTSSISTNARTGHFRPALGRVIALFVAVALTGVPLAAETEPAPAEDVPGAAASEQTQAKVGAARLVVSRSAETPDCAGAADLTERLGPLVGDSSHERPVTIAVSWSRAASTYRAEVVVTEGGAGARTLTSAEPTCTALVEQVVAVLALLLEPTPGSSSPSLVLLEESPSASEAPPSDSELPAPREPPPQPATEAPSDTPSNGLKSQTFQAARAPRDRLARSEQKDPDQHVVPHVFTFVHVGGVGGLAPEPRAFAAADLRLAGDFWLASMALFGSFPGDSRARDGAIETYWVGVAARPCLTMIGSPATTHASACSQLSVGMLRAEAQGYPIVEPAVVRSWYGLGGGLALGGPLSERLYWALDLSGTVPLRREQFSVRGLGVVFETPSASLWLSAGAGTKW